MQAWAMPAGSTAQPTPDLALGPRLKRPGRCPRPPPAGWPRAGRPDPRPPGTAGGLPRPRGRGSMFVDDERFDLAAGATVIAPRGSRRGIEAETRLAFLAIRVGPDHAGDLLIGRCDLDPTDHGAARVDASDLRAPS